ncbi:hypothetical protein Sste5346_008993 [Sporothrix stenoceras]|uniref:Zn(2)-C6 fungal-type domain-containing protein n=1 Tax=Sporothrix stenoceras TaxID=5173 RepID=A0ABR3YLM6_9PEZI
MEEREDRPTPTPGPPSTADTSSVTGHNPGGAGTDSPEPKRRKVRKGTHTCWECKRRKVRCTFAQPGDAVCIGCTKRCLPCVSQEFPEDPTTPTVKSRLVGDRIVRVEAMIQQLVHQAGQNPGSIPIQPGSLPHLATQLPVQLPPHPPHRRSRDQSPDTATTATSSSSSSATAASSMPTPAASDTSTAVAMPSHNFAKVMPSSIAANPQSFQELSSALLAVYPPQHDLDLIASCADTAYNYYQIVVRSQQDIQKSGFWPPGELRTRHTPQTHPVIIARQMLLIAMVLQGSDPLAQKELDGGQLSEPVRNIITRLGDTAARLVTANDALLDTLDTLDGLECIMLEAMYRGNAGRLRRAWLTWRRALSLAQLMCIPRRPHRNPASTSTTTAPVSVSVSSTFTSLSMTGTHSLDPQFLWYRILSAERFLCLLLGLPQAAFEAPIASNEMLRNDTPMGQLEQKLSMITSYILDRNDRGHRFDDHTTTEQIDREMQRIAATLPSRWWLAPNMAAVPPGDHEQSVWEMVRLTNQVLYYNILNQLHLPYMLHPPPSTIITAADQRRLEYSRVASVSASREVLSRYVLFRSFNSSACCCRLLEFFALMASLTLILVHIDGHRHTAQHGPASNVLAHQRLSDRAMMEEALDSMDLVGKLNEEDTISETSVDLLRQLLAIEADTAMGSSHALESLCSRNGGLGGSKECDSAEGAACDKADHAEGRAAASAAAAAGKLRISVPYVGFITIARDGEITKEAHPTQDTPAFSVGGGSGEGMVVPRLVPSPIPSPHQTHQQAQQTLPHHHQQQQQHQPHLGMVPDVNAQPPFPSCLAENDPIASNQPPVGLLYPGATTSNTQHNGNSIGAADPWAFQGVDMAFFDSLMRETSSVANVANVERACSTDATVNNDCTASPAVTVNTNPVNNNPPGASRNGSLWMSTTSGPHGVQQQRQQQQFMGSRVG